ncbi:MAG TPA: hypothetical protein VMD30_11460 [Tepidisphaeraceae bacterium]|nr:hypothetical protein [Tepidisphaeraceae bacterium]
MRLPKPNSNREQYLESLRRMTPEQRLTKAMELSELGKQLFLHGLRRRFPEADEKQIKAIYLERIGKCHNRNY